MWTWERNLRRADWAQGEHSTKTDLLYELLGFTTTYHSLSVGRKNEKFYIVDKRLNIYHSMAFNYLMYKNHLKINI